MSTTTTYETGATSHAVNDLILFTDNKRKLAEYRDKLFLNMAYSTNKRFYLSMLLDAARAEYYKEFGKGQESLHIMPDDEKWGVHPGKWSAEMTLDYYNLYDQYFNDWAKEHGYK